MSYIERTLISGEEIKHRFTVSKYCYLKPFFNFIVAFILMVLGLVEKNGEAALVIGVMALIFVLIGLFVVFEIMAIDMCVTNKRIIFKKGLLTVDTDEMINAKVESIEITQTLLGRILGYGAIQVKGTGSSIVNLVMVKNPIMCKRLIEETLEEARRSEK